MDPHIIFAGYRVRHPMKNDILLRIQTDGEKCADPKTGVVKNWTPIEAFKKAIYNLSDELASLHYLIEI
jgi:DNA-directed RNA polymerase subunit L